MHSSPIAAMHQLFGLSQIAIAWSCFQAKHMFHIGEESLQGCPDGKGGIWTSKQACHWLDAYPANDHQTLLPICLFAHLPLSLVTSVLNFVTPGRSFSFFG